MKKSDMKIMIREMVREEVAMAIREVITELKKPMEQKSADTRVIKGFKKRMSKKRNLAKDPVLNDILNETKGGISTGGEFENYPTMNSSRLVQMLGHDTDEDTKRNANVAQTLQEMGKSVNDIPEGVVNAMTRDYSGLMNAMKEKKSGTK